MTRAAKNEQASIDKLLANLQSVVTDAEALLKATSQHAGEKVQEARAKAEESLTAAREHLSKIKLQHLSPEQSDAERRILSAYDWLEHSLECDDDWCAAE